MYQDVQSYLKFKYAQAEELFSPASPFGQILSVILDLSRLMFYYLEDSLTELNIYTATRDSSIKTIARISGHNPTRAISATGLLNIQYNGTKANISNNIILIPNKTKLTCQSNGLPYLINIKDEVLRINLESRTNISVGLIQGSLESQQLTGTGENLQSFNVKPKRGQQIDNFNVQLYVNSQPWQKYESIYDIPYNSNGYVIKTGLSEGIDVFFGNEFFGKKPELGSTIIIEYIITNGNFGNIYETDNTNWTFDGEGFDISGNNIDLNPLFNVSITKPVDFGSDAEPIEMTRLMTANVSRSFVLANEWNYIYFLQKWNQFSVIESYTTGNDGNLEDDNIVYLFLIPDINKRKTSDQNYFSINKSRFTLTADEKQKIKDTINNSGQKIITTELAIIDPVVRQYVLNINVRAYQGYEHEILRGNIINKCSEYMLTNRRRDKIPKSDFIAIIENIDGIDSVNVWFISELDEFNIKNNINGDSGLDEFGDINILKNEYPLIRGGWLDRNDIEYKDALDNTEYSSINIFFSKNATNDFNKELSRVSINKIK
jgi:hypothetical protein